MIDPAQRELFRPAARLVDALAAFAGLIFGLAESGPIPFLTPVAGVLAFFFVDGRKPRGLPTSIAAALGFAAFGVSAAEFMNGDVEARILAGGHLLTYLTVIVLFQAKLRPDLYRLVTLSTLQMALAALLTNSVWLAIGLVVYMALAFHTMSTLLWTRLRSEAGSSGEPATEDSRANALWRLIRPTLRLTFITCVVGGASFAFVPRIWSGHIGLFNNDLPPGAVAETGFSEEVALGEIGQVMESDDLVCEIRSVDLETGETSRFDEEAGALGLSAPLLRGAVMDTYDGGSWKRDTSRGTLFSANGFRSFGLRGRDENQVIQHTIKVEPLGTRILFTPGWTADYLQGDDNEPVNFDAEFQMFVRTEDADLTDQFEYTLFTRKDWPFGPNPRNFIRYRGNFRGNRMLDKLRSIGGDFGSVVKTEIRGFMAIELPEVDELQPPLEIAESLLRFLRDSGKYGYTLNLKPPTDGVDPVVYFLRTAREGHCEYFASAMALMLRSLNVPTRLVNGFKGGHFDEEEGVFRVRQLHAHAWLEVYDSDSNAWYTYDPTPGAREAIVSQRTENARTQSTGLNRLQTLWGQGMFMTRQQQQRHIYRPIGNLVSDGWSAIKEGTSGLTGSGGGPRSSVTVAGQLIILFLIAGFAVMTFAIVRSLRKRKQEDPSDEISKRRHHHIGVETPWYERFVTLVRNVLHKQRDASDTQREFSEVVALTAKSIELPAGDEKERTRERLGDLASDVTRAFYAARFGDKSMSTDALRRLNEELEALEHASGITTETGPSKT